MAIKETTTLVFDSRLGYGSPEHFFHFFWGYLLPALHLTQANNKNECLFVFESCGPIMDKITHELMTLCKVDYAIHTKLVSNEQKNVVPRWDIYFLQPLIITNKLSKYEDIQQIKAKLTHYPDLVSELSKGDFLEQFANILQKLKKFITDLSEQEKTEPNWSQYLGEYLILSRSAQPKFYSKWFGRAKISGYGAARRALVNIEKTVCSLRQKRIPVQHFEPGKFNFKQQVNVFTHCKGIIGIKGAEFANLFWLAPKSLVILIKPTSMETAPVQRCMAKVFDLEYVEIETNEGMFPRLTPELLVGYLEQKCKKI